MAEGLWTSDHNTHMCLLNISFQSHKKWLGPHSAATTAFTLVRNLHYIVLSGCGDSAHSTTGTLVRLGTDFTWEGLISVPIHPAQMCSSNFSKTLLHVSHFADTGTAMMDHVYTWLNTPCVLVKWKFYVMQRKCILNNCLGKAHI